jgi:hypothetical protein
LFPVQEICHVPCPCAPWLAPCFPFRCHGGADGLHGGFPALAAPGGANAAQKAQIERSVGLRESWEYLTRDIAWPAHWAPDSSAFTYRKTVEGGFAFETVDAATLARSPAFDHVRLAGELTRALGHLVQPLRLPFAEVDIEGTGDGRAIAFAIDEQGWRCTLADYHCAPQVEPLRPRGFGVVRDLSVPADNHPRLSPDGQHEALVEDNNLAVRKKEGPARCA